MQFFLIYGQNQFRLCSLFFNPEASIFLHLQFHDIFINFQFQELCIGIAFPPFFYFPYSICTFIWEPFFYLDFYISSLFEFCFPVFSIFHFHLFSIISFHSIAVTFWIFSKFLHLLFHEIFL